VRFVCASRVWGLGHPVALLGALSIPALRARDLAFLAPPASGSPQERGHSVRGAGGAPSFGCPESQTQEKPR
jgi:hypothetical protein